MHDMNKPILFGTVALTLLAAMSFVPLVAAQYAGVGGGGDITLEDQLELAKRKVDTAAANPA
ncbi:MAG: hypothetical protein ACREAF_05780, partial [Nitrosopumilaceae archaeon]